MPQSTVVDLDLFSRHIAVPLSNGVRSERITAYTDNP